jgi:nicotinamidase/pyrazinamidase
MLYKGMAVDRDEYSIMHECRRGSVIVRLVARAQHRAHRRVRTGRQCVCAQHRARPCPLCGPSAVRILTDYAPSLDDGSELRAFIGQEGLDSL